MRVFIVVIIALAMIGCGNFVFANGGDQRVLDGKYLVNLSRSPFTFRSGVENHMLISFLDVQKNQPIREDLIVRIRIAKLTQPGADPQFIFDKSDIRAERGKLEFAYSFKDSGFHEIFIDFAFSTKPAEFFQMPDFLVEVQKPDAVQGYSVFEMLAAAFAGGLLFTSFLVTFGFLHRRRSL